MILLKHEKYNSLYGEMSMWRNKTHSLSTDNKKGILPFVSGLRFSANIIYILNELFEGSQLKAVWGHIINQDQEYNIYSKECDIIIYKSVPNCVIRKWNGNKTDRVMDFHFIDVKAVVGVISCKSKIKSIEEREYAKLMKPYAKKVWLFAECCGHDKEAALKEKAKEYKYTDLWTLYSWDPKKGAKANEESWKKFEDTMRKLAEKHPK